jgi:hypothetical protein
VGDRFISLVLTDGDQSLAADSGFHGDPGQLSGYAPRCKAPSFWANGFQLEPATATYLQTVNRLLFVWNTANFLSLVNGQEIPGLSGKRGKDLDYGLVDFEQKKVDTYTGSYFSDSSAKKAAVANINALTESSFAPDAVRTALLSRFTSKGKTYSFDSLNDREQLGYGIVDWVYQFTSPLDYASGYH